MLFEFKGWSSFNFFRSFSCLSNLAKPIKDLLQSSINKVTILAARANFKPKHFERGRERERERKRKREIEREKENEKKSDKAKEGERERERERESMICNLM